MTKSKPRPMSIRQAGLALALLVCSIVPIQAQTASDIAADYFRVLKNREYVAAAALFHPDALAEFRQLMAFLGEIPAEAQKNFFEAFFGPGTTKESIAALSDAQFFASFLRAVMAQAEAMGALNLDSMEVVGEVMEGAGTSHVVTRNKVSMGELDLETMEVVSFRKTGDTWRLLLSGRMKGMASQLRQSLAK